MKKHLYLFILVLFIVIMGCGSDNNEGLNGKIIVATQLVDESTVKLTWNGIPDVEGYRIFRNGNLYNTVNAGITEYVDSGLGMGVTYTYSVIGYRGKRDTEMSNTASVATKDYYEEKAAAFNSSQIGAIKFLRFSAENKKLGFVTEYCDWGIFDCSDSDSQNWSENNPTHFAKTGMTVYDINKSGTKIFAGFDNGKLEVLGDANLFESMSGKIESINFIDSKNALVATQNKIKMFDVGTQSSTDVGYSANITGYGDIAFADQPYSSEGDINTVVVYKNGDISLYYSNNKYRKKLTDLVGTKSLNIARLTFDKKMLITSFNEDNFIEIRNIGEAEPDSWVKVQATIYSPAKLKYLETNNTGTRILAGYANNKAYLYNENGMILKIFDINDGSEEALTGVAISEDGSLIALGKKDKIKIYKLK